MSNKLKKERYIPEIPGVEFGYTPAEQDRMIRSCKEINVIVSDKNNPNALQEIDPAKAEIAKIQDTLYLFADGFCDGDFERLRKLAIVRGAV